MKQKAITAVALAASFSAGYISAPPLPHSVNPSIIKQGEDDRKAREIYIKSFADCEARGRKSVEKIPKAQK